MKIAFVNDCIERLGVEYISALLKNAGHDVKLFVDPQLFDDVHIHHKALNRYFDHKQKIIADLLEYRPDLIAFSVDTESYAWASGMARAVKSRMEAPVIFGGIHPSSVPDHVIRNDAVDILCVGEGEYPMLELAESMARGEMDTHISNLWFKQQGKIVRNPLRPLLKDLDVLPYADHDLFYSHSPYFQQGYGTIVSRGCPYTCSYCCHSYLRKLYQANGTYLRLRSVSNVIEELKDHVAKYDVGTITFFDDNFGYNFKWLEEFSREYARAIKKRFKVTTHPEIVSREYIRLLKDAGCCSVDLGIQSWDRQVRRYWFQRDVETGVMRRAMELIKEARLELICDNIFNVPAQDDEQYIQTLLPYTDIKPHRIIFNQLKYYPGVAITEKAKREGFIGEERYRMILDGADQKGVYLDEVVLKERERKSFVKMKVFLYLMDCFPKKFSRYVIMKKIYRYFPGIFNPAFFLMFRTLFSSDSDTQYLKQRTLARYRYHIGRRLRLKLFSRRHNEQSK